MYEYEMSEKLFLDIWEKYECPEEVSDPLTIYNILNDIIVKSKHWIVLDHYSHINFDEVKKVEYDETTGIFKLFWLDNNSFREKRLRHEIDEFEMLIWQMSGYCTYEYIALDINKLRFVKRKNHLYVLMQANMISEKEMQSKVIGKNEIICVDNCTEELYARYVFWEGDKENLIKVECIANNLPYYVCLIQPKEGIKGTFESKQILLTYTLKEIDKRLKRVGVALKEDIEDRDEIFSKGNTIRNILEYTLKHFCVIRGIEMNIEQKYGHIDLGELRKKIKDIPNINIPQSLVNTANELSHDSGKKYNIENVREFYGDVCELIKQIKDTIWTEENDL